MAPTIRHTLDDLKAFQPRHATFVGVDSDGCVFDTMEIKQKQCFHGLIISHWELERIERPVRDAAEFVNLYSKWRGQNRFSALVKMFDLLAGHPGLRGSGVALPPLVSLRAHIAAGGNLSDGALRVAAESSGDAELASLLRWSIAVNERVAQIAAHTPPFPWARRCLERIRRESDAACVSQTPTEALVREWDASGLLGFIDLIAGQELGTKTEHLAMATRGRYQPGCVLMIGDAEGDLKAAEANEALFYPINPAGEDASWERFHREAFDRFLNGTFAGDYQRAVVREFLTLLPETPPWLART